MKKHGDDKQQQSKNKKKLWLSIIVGFVSGVVVVPVLFYGVVFAFQYFNYHNENINSDCIILTEDDYSKVSEYSYEDLYADDKLNYGISSIESDIKNMHVDELMTGQTYYCVFAVSFFRGEFYNPRNPQGHVAFPEESVEILDCNVDVHEFRTTTIEYLVDLLKPDKPENASIDYYPDGSGVNFSLDTKITFLRMFVVVKFTPLKEGRIDVISSVNITANIFNKEDVAETHAECGANAYYFDGVSISNFKTEFGDYTDNFDNAILRAKDTLENGTEYYAVTSFDLTPLRETQCDKIAVEIAFDKSFSALLYMADSGDYASAEGKITVYYTLPADAEMTKSVKIVLRITPHISGVFDYRVTVNGEDNGSFGEYSDAQKLTVN